MRFGPTYPLVDSSGFSLIETMVATAVFSFGLAGMASMMLSAAGGMSEAERQTLATLHADAMAAALQMSPAALEHLANPPESVPLCFEVDDCTAEQWLTSRYVLWRSRVANDLPQSQGIVCRDASPMDGNREDAACDGDGGVVSKVFWTETRHQHDEDGGARRAVATVPQ